MHCSTILVVILEIFQFTIAHSNESNFRQLQQGFPEHYERTLWDSKALSFSEGDIIACVIPEWWNLYGFAEHVMLASSTATIIHSGYPLFKDWTTVVVEDPFAHISSAFKNCRTVTGKYDIYMKKHFGKEPFSNQVAVENARRSVQRFRGEKIPYDIRNCNCDQWANLWKYGIPYSPQTDYWAPFHDGIAKGDCALFRN